MTDPATRAAKAIHSLRAASLRRWASKLVPTASSATAPASTPGRAALAITVRTPDHEAMRAASSLLAMPPLPRSLPPCARPGSRAAGRRRCTRVDELGVGIDARVGGVQTVEVGEQHEHGGADVVGDERGEPVVVAVADLVAGDGVVLVDDRHRAQLEQAGERPPGVEVLAAVDEVVRHEQRLRRHEAVGAERGRPSCASAGAGRRRRAPAAWRRRSGRDSQAERGHPGGDRAGGHDDDLVPAARTAATSALSLAIASSSTPPRSSVTDDVPTLTTTLHAAITAGTRS